jgi:hypothetical protein
MPTYLFQALDRNGSLFNGKVEADSVEVARERVTEWGYRGVRFLQAFVFQASDSRGKPVTAEIEAENLDEAKILLTKGGFNRIKFLSSDNVQAVRAATFAGSARNGEVVPRITPRFDLESRKRRTVRHKILWAVGKHMVYLGPLLGFNALSLIRVGPFRFEDKLGFACTAGYLVWMTIKLTPMVCYHQLLDACMWKDWKRMRRHVRLWRLASRVRRVKVGEYDVATREVYALAAEGRLPEALEQMERIRVTYPIARHIFLGRLASVYMYAGEFDKQRACAHEALEAGPKRSLEWVDYATLLAWRGHDIAGAKEALNQARKFEMAEIVKAAALRCSGIIALADRDFARAHDDLRLAVVGLTEHASTPVGEFLTTEAKAFLAVAAAHLGRHDEAKAIWGQVEPVLKARKDTWVISQYTEAIGSARSLK